MYWPVYALEKLCVSVWSFAVRRTRWAISCLFLIVKRSLTSLLGLFTTLNTYKKVNSLLFTLMEMCVFIFNSQRCSVGMQLDYLTHHCAFTKGIQTITEQTWCVNLTHTRESLLTKHTNLSHVLGTINASEFGRSTVPVQRFQRATTQNSP